MCVCVCVCVCFIHIVFSFSKNFMEPFFHSLSIPVLHFHFLVCLIMFQFHGIQKYKHIDCYDIKLYQKISFVCICLLQISIMWVIFKTSCNIFHRLVFQYPTSHFSFPLLVLLIS